MKDFQTSRVVAIWSAILSVALLLTIVLLAVVWVKADNATSGVRADTAQLKKSVQSPTHGKDIALWCNGINGIINYERQYTKGTLKQSESEAQQIEKAIAAPHANGLTSAQATFIHLYLDSVVALEREAPQTLSLHPFALGDLNCKQIEAGEAASIKH